LAKTKHPEPEMEMDAKQPIADNDTSTYIHDNKKKGRDPNET